MKIADPSTRVGEAVEHPRDAIEHGLDLRDGVPPNVAPGDGDAKSDPLHAPPRRVQSSALPEAITDSAPAATPAGPRRCGARG